MKPISIDIAPLISAVPFREGLATALGSAILSNLTVEIYKRWQAEAGKALRSTRKQYINSINIQNTGKYENTIFLTGRLPNMIENGVSAFDLKVGLLNGQKSKVGKNGVRYNTVPFRFATPNAVGESDAFSSVMPNEVYEVAKQLEATITQMGMGTSYGGKLTNVPSPYDTATIRPKIVDDSSELQVEQLEAYQRKFSIFASMIRNEKIYEKAKQSQYVTFRRVSEKSAPNAFIHKGIKAYNLANKALESTNVAGVVMDTRNKTLKSFGI